jgi:hypothetical protein
VLCESRGKRNLQNFQTPTPRELCRCFVYSESNCLFPTLLMTDGDTFLFDTPSGHVFACELLKTRTPKPVHDYIIEGVCKVLDGIHLLSVVKTGGGKSSYWSSYIHILHALSALPSPPKLKRRLPENPLAVVVYPTKGLEEEQVSLTRSARLSYLLTGIRRHDLRLKDCLH